jgi:tetraacyldisaccharide 4'-kinase
MRAPKFWNSNNIISILLSPFSFIYGYATKSRTKKSGYKSSVPVICLGNITAGGTGKTPAAIEIARYLIAEGKKVAFVSRGYRGNFEGVVKVAKQTADIVGDEPLLLARVAPTWISKDRAEAVKLAEKEADIIIMDDGFQNPAVEKTIAIIVVDGEYGFGNGRIIPAGPMRETLESGLKRADAVLVIGQQKHKFDFGSTPTFKAKLEMEIQPELHEESVVAFCGIGRPSKFFDGLKENKVEVVEELSFPDHHHYTDSDFKAIFGIASKHKSIVATTEKDMVKVPDHFRKVMYAVKAKLKIEAQNQFYKIIFSKLGTDKQAA